MAEKLEALPKQYTIATLQDMMKIPLEKFGVFLSEFSQAITVARMAHAYNQAFDGPADTIRKPFIWIDDGKGEIRTNITFVEKKGDWKE